MKVYGCMKVASEISLRTMIRSVFALGRIDHVHFSPPCKGFSTANRNETISDNDRVNNDLSLLIIDVIRKTSCATAVFENVLGMWRRKNVHYTT